MALRTATSDMTPLVSTVALPRWGSSTVFVESPEARGHLGLAFVHVESRSAQMAALQRQQQGGLVDDRASGGVDQERAGRMSASSRRRYEVVGVGSERHVQADDSRLRGARSSSVALYSHVAPAGTWSGSQRTAATSCRRPSCPSRARAGRPPARCGPCPRCRGSLRPQLGRAAGREPTATSTLAHHGVTLDHPAGDREDQRPGEIGGGVGEHAGSVGDEDAPLGRRRDVDVVEADRHVGDDPQMPPPAASMTAPSMPSLSRHSSACAPGTPASSCSRGSAAVLVAAGDLEQLVREAKPGSGMRRVRKRRGLELVVMIAATSSSCCSSILR